MKSPSPRRWLQFGLRTTLVATLLLGVALGYWCNRAARLRKAVAALESLGGAVHWDGNQVLMLVGDRGNVLLSSAYREPPPAGLGWLGPEYLHNPTSVLLGRDVPFEQVVSHLQALPELQSVYFWGDEQAARKVFGDLEGVELFVVRHGRCGDLFVEPLTDKANP